ncbi:MAG: DHHA1 domain-containing protein [Bacillota bacterium]|nr:DHHA1 domain-containing protein [Bacillota bacterium]
MTIKLYDTKPYETEFIAQVLSCSSFEKGYDIILDQTLFFPEEGGQTCDKGVLNDIDVFDVQIQNGIVHHYTKSKVEGMVHGKIDWAHRYSNMQNHSGEHVLSGVVHALYGFNNSGFHLSDTEITTDYDGFLTKEQIQEVERRANQIILENYPITSAYPENVADLVYRSKKEIKEAIRIVTIENVDVCACCAPHVRSTAEIGMIKIVKSMKFKKGVRLFFVCGQKAYQDYLVKHNQCATISNLLSSPVEEISNNVSRILQDVYVLKQKLSALKKETINQKAKFITSKEIQCVFEEDLDKQTQQYYFNLLNQNATKHAYLFVKIEEGYRFMIGSKEDANALLAPLKDKFIVRGGGKDHFVQGTILASQEEIEKIINKNGV